MFKIKIQNKNVCATVILDLLKIYTFKITNPLYIDYSRHKNKHILLQVLSIFQYFFYWKYLNEENYF